MAVPAVVVTGVGMVTPLGATAALTRARFLEGAVASWNTPPGLEGTGLLAAADPAIDAAAVLGRRMLKYMSHTALLACVAAREATAQAQLQTRFRPERIGLFAGLGLQGANPAEMNPILAASLDEQGELSLPLLGTRGLAAAAPTLSFKILANMPACLVSILEGIKGPSFLFSPWESQTAGALLEALQAVTSGEVDCALVGGADAAAAPTSVLHLCQAKLLHEGERAGSAAAWLCLEREETARRDGRVPWARIGALDIGAGGSLAQDPLAPRMGRTFAAAPAVLLALASLGAVDGDVRMVSTDGEVMTSHVEALS